MASYSVLIVEDEALIALVYGEYFTSAGITAHKASTVTQAKGLLDKYDDIAFVLLDRHLKNNEKGEAVLTHLAAKATQGQAVPLVVTTTADDYTGAGVFMSLTKMGMDAFMMAHRDARDFTKENLVSFRAQRRVPEAFRPEVTTFKR